MPTVMLYQSPRTPELRSAAISAITDAITVDGLRPDQVTAYFQEVPDDQWGRDGVLASDRHRSGKGGAP
jgi:phenylpyruvate tautomerase PptA (4-oxalocrotonate tautomerase family)